MSQSADCLRERDSGLEVVDAVEAGVAQEHALVGAHRERVLDGVAGGVGAEADDCDLAVAGSVLEPKRGLRGLRVEGVHDGRDALCGDDLLRGLVDSEGCRRGLGVGDLFDAHNDVHAVAEASCHGPVLAGKDAVEIAQVLLRDPYGKNPGKGITPAVDCEMRNARAWLRCVE
jgi:hypothetical protein